MSRCWGLVGVMLVGCAGGGVPIEKYCDEFAVALCEEQKNCGAFSGSVDCTSAELLTDCLSYARAGLDAGTLTYDALAAQTCLDDLSTEAICRATLGGPLRPASCQSVVVGTSKEGEACGTCASGLTCAHTTDGCGTCQRVPTTTPPLPGPGEACSSPVNDGVGCKLDAWCGTSGAVSGVCQASAAVGESCSDTPCVHVASCVDGVCAAKADLGAACGAAGCLGGLSCINNRCEALRKLGATCVAADQCWTTLCLDGACSAGREIGKVCDFDAPCRSELMCVNGTCVPRPGPGEACVDACAGSAFCDQGTCVDFTLQVCR